VRATGDDTLAIGDALYRLFDRTLVRVCDGERPTITRLGVWRWPVLPPFQTLVWLNQKVAAGRFAVIR